MSGTIAVDLKGRFAAFRLEAAFEVPTTGVTAITGPSGAGKTTLLRCIAGLDRAEGRVVVDGETWQDGRRFVPPHRRGVGYVFQEAGLFPHLSLQANLRYGQDRALSRLGGRAGGPPGLQFEEVVGLLGLEPLLHRSPDKLSGGERQRGAIARALLSQPRLLLMDEPTAALDADARRELLPYLERLHAELSLPILYVSHHLAEVDRLADRVLAMAAGKVAPVDRMAAQGALDARVAALPDAELRQLAAEALRARGE